MGDRAAARHLGLDLGGTNIKWAVVERDGDAWRSIDRDQAPTHGGGRPGRVVARLASRRARGERPRPGRSTTVGIGVPGLYDPVDGRDALPRQPARGLGRQAGRRARSATALGVPAVLDQRRPGLRARRASAGRRPRRRHDDRAGARDGRGRRASRSTVGRPGPRRHRRRDRPPDARARTARSAAAATAAASRRSHGPTGSRQPAAPTRSRRPSPERGRATRQAVAGLAQVGRYLGIGIANMVVGALAGSGGDRRRRRGVPPTCCSSAIREELRRRVFTTSLDEVEVVTAELGIWAGAIGAAIHGAEAAMPATSPEPLSAGRP